MILREAIARLYAAGIEDARREAKLIFSELAGKSELDMLSPECKSDDAVLISAIERRCKREPLQYILGKVGFYREEYLLGECLIPRADTEILVDYAVGRIPAGESFIDLCTGSGCVAISTLCNTAHTRAVAVDISDGALECARRNAEHNKVADRLTLVHADVLCESIEGEFFALLSNPPYVKEAVYATLEPEIFHEPKIAFVGGEDGLDFYKRIIPLYKDKIKRGGFMALEIGYDQGAELEKIACSYGLDIKILKDYSGNDRVAVIDL